MPLVNKVLYHIPADVRCSVDSAWVFLWAPVAWALIGYLLTGMRQVRKTGGDGPDSLYLAAVLSVIMARGLLRSSRHNVAATAVGQSDAGEALAC